VRTELVLDQNDFKRNRATTVGLSSRYHRNFWSALENLEKLNFSSYFLEQFEEEIQFHDKMTSSGTLFADSCTEIIN
jgi:hypothetical protein